MAHVKPTSGGEGEPREAAATPRRSLVIPIYRNEENIADLLTALAAINDSAGGMEVVFVVDGSPDRSGELLLAARGQMPFPSTIAFHSRNFGSFTAIRTGLELAKGASIAVMAADLQEPPELIVRFFSMLENDEADVVFGQRAGRHDSMVRDALSNAFWWLYRKLVIRDIPKGGVDIFACNRTVRDAVLEIAEPNSSLIAQLFWVGFRRTFVPYERRPRLKGESAWNFSRRLRYMMDSIFSFSDLPILFVLWFGVAGCVVSLLVGLVIALARLFGFITEPGYAALAILITFSASAMMAVQGILGSYLWRTFENTKQRPLRIISQIVDTERTS
jgi:glycosyltransferase involved in cell wall biosynthesis